MQRLYCIGATWILKFWDYAIKYANILYNITPRKGNGNKVPNELFYHKKVDLKYIKVFGCVSYYKNFAKNKSKFQSKGIFLGLNIESNCYIIMDSKELNIHLVREAVFDESSPGTIISNKNFQNLPTNIFNNDNYISETGFINTNIDINNTHSNNNENIIYTEQNNNYNNSNNNNNNNNTDIKDNDNSIDNQKPINDSTKNIINKLEVSLRKKVLTTN